jgi:hypothetical protein
VAGLAGGGALALTALVSCSSTTIAPANVYVTSTLGPNTSDPDMMCAYASVMTQLVIGTDSVNGGVTTGTMGTSVTCSVTPSGSSFDVSVDVTGGGGGFSINGTLPATGTGSGVSASLTYGQIGAQLTYSDPSCSVTLANSMTAGFGTGAAIDGGRAWATVTCDNMTVGGQPGHICQGVITFRVENCVGSIPTTSS